MRKTKDIDKHSFTLFLDQNVSETITFKQQHSLKEKRYQLIHMPSYIFIRNQHAKRIKEARQWCPDRLFWP